MGSLVLPLPLSIAICEKKAPTFQRMDRVEYHAVDDPEKKRSKSAGIQCLFQLIIGGVMLFYGISYQDDCKNGATDFLVTGGAITIASNILPFITAIVILFAICDDHISKSESCVVKGLLYIQAFLPFMSIVVTIWGSIVIFSAYGTWTYAAEDAGLPDYCAKPPFECAFVLLILNSVAVLIMVACLCCLCCALCAAKNA